MKTLEESKAEFTIDNVWDALRDAQAELTVAADQAETLRRERDELAARCAAIAAVTDAIVKADDGLYLNQELIERARATVANLPAAALRCQMIVEAADAAKGARVSPDLVEGISAHDGFKAGWDAAVDFIRRDDWEEVQEVEP